jgi:hypothetical protein
MFSPLYKEKYWRTVEATLVEIMGMDSGEAYQKVLKLRLHIEKGYKGQPLDIAYHDEPINVAASLVGYNSGEFDYAAYNKHYNAIRERYLPIEKSPEVEIYELRFTISQKFDDLQSLMQKLGELLEKEKVESN